MANAGPHSRWASDTRFLFRSEETILKVPGGIHGLHTPEDLGVRERVGGSTVNLTMDFWSDDTQTKLLTLSNRLASEVKLALEAVGIDMAYPHQVVILHGESNR